MKKIFVLFFYMSTIVVMAQYSTPGNYHSYTIEDLVAISNGAVTLGGDQYYFNEDIIISATDTLHMNTDNTFIEIGEGLLWTIEGVLIIDVEEMVSISKKFNEGNFLGIRFDNSSASSLKKAFIRNCGGVKLIESDIFIDQCSFFQFDQAYSTPALSLFYSSPVVQNSFFSNNQGPGIGSGANGASSPQIINNTFEHNVNGNGNTPQINLGPSSGITPIIIDGNTITGQYDMAGGIALSTLVGGNINAQVTNNDIRDNRYGIAMIGSNISADISHNIIIGNHIQNDPMLGGSGLNFYGGESNQCTVSHNTIMDNLWGITIQLNAQPNLGDGSAGSPGHNQFYDNGNGGETYALYNNTPGDIMALNNFWATISLTEAESYIFHKVDDLSLGEVFFDPMWTNPVGLEESAIETTGSIYPNPCSHSFLVDYDFSCDVSIYKLAGQEVLHLSEAQKQDIDVSTWDKGCYILNIKTAFENKIEKLIIQ